jgi:TPR repeat protein
MSLPSIFARPIARGIFLTGALLASAPFAWGESPFVDFVQFGKHPPRRPTAVEHRDERPWPGMKVPNGDYILGSFGSIIDRALDPKAGKLVIRRSPAGKWIAASVTFTAHDHSFATPGYPYLGRIIASTLSSFTVSVSADGIVTGTEVGATDNLNGSGIGYPPDGHMSWQGTETLDLNTGEDQWHFDGSMKGQYHNGRPKTLPGAPVSGTLTASDSVHRDLTIVAGFDESRAGADLSADSTEPGNDRALIIGDLTLRDATGAALLRFNDRAVLSIPIANQTHLDLNGLSRTITTAETVTGVIAPGKLSGVARVARDAKFDLPLDIITNFSVPAGGLHFTVTFTYHKTILARKTITVPTEAFYRTEAVTLPDSASRRLRSIAKYFGTAGVQYGDPAPELAARRGDLETMWDAVFLSQGVAGYALDQDKAYHLTRGVLPTVEERARDGDAEALYLLFYACELGAEGDDAQDVGRQFLERSASAGFLPARFDLARESSFRKDSRNAAQALKEVYDAGVKKAAVILGEMYERGIGVERDQDAALKWYRIGAEFGDPEAILCLANVQASGFGDTPPDAGKAMKLAKQAADMGYSPAMIFIGQAYLSGRQGVAQDVAAAIKAFGAAAEVGDRQAMLALGETYLGNAPGLTPNDRSGLFWIRKAADRESPKAMLILSKFYAEGTMVDRDPIASRYWFNQAALRGYVHPDNRGIAAAQQTFLDFWRYADFSPSYVYVNEYGTAVGDSGDSMLNGLFSGLFGAMASYYGNQQQMIDGLELMGKHRGRKIYGGTVSSHFVSSLQLKAGETASIRSYGIISTGMMSGLADADGLGPNWPEYRIVPYIPCSAVMAQVVGTPWQLVGKSNRLTARENGPLALALNAIDYRNYKGYFDLVVEVPDEN